MWKNCKQCNVDYCALCELNYYFSFCLSSVIQEYNIKIIFLLSLYSLQWLPNTPFFFKVHGFFL